MSIGLKYCLRLFRYSISNLNTFLSLTQSWGNKNIRIKKYKYPNKNDHMRLSLSMKKLLAATASASKRQGIEESFKIFSFCLLKLEKLSVRPALHRITQNDMFLQKKMIKIKFFVLFSPTLDMALQIALKLPTCCYQYSFPLLTKRAHFWRTNRLATCQADWVS